MGALHSRPWLSSISRDPSAFLGTTSIRRPGKGRTRLLTSFDVSSCPRGLRLAHPCRGRLSTQLLPLGCIKPLGCFHPRECPVPRPLPPEGKKERWPPAGKACILPSLQKPGTGPKRGAASVHSAISGALRGTRRPARRLGGATERQVGCKP